MKVRADGHGEASLLATTAAPARVAVGARRIAELALLGVPVTIDISWLFGVGLATWTFADAVLPLAAPDRGLLAYTVTGALAASLVLASIAVHEVGHWVAARRAGLTVRRATLSLLGGSTELGDAPTAPGVALRIALAGPATSLGCAAVGALVHVVLVESDADPLLSTVAAIVAVGNVFVAAGNLLPALPLDGGQILHAALWALTDRESTARLLTAWSGRVVAVTLVGIAVVASASGDAALALWFALVAYVVF